ncbi:hypothetical protein AAVH_31351 [Aphelenchoides avenae]|nr:hypothetical protein AAVH_31351 [Aphelenchus avenae]
MDVEFKAKASEFAALLVILPAYCNCCNSPSSFHLLTHRPFDKRIDLFAAALLGFRRRLVTTMLLFTVLATLLCSTLVDAVQAPVKSTDALQQCQSLGYCNNPALEIGEEPEFRPTIRASPSGGVKLSLAVKSNQRLTFLVRTEDYLVTWVIKGPDDECPWEITSIRGTVSFKDSTGSSDSCSGKTGRDVSVTVDVKRKNVELADVTDGSCKRPIKLGACDYALPDSASIPNFDVWTLSISAPDSPDPSASIELKGAFVVYNAPDTTTSMTTANVNGAGNGTTHTPGNHTTPHNSTAHVGLSITTYALIVVSALL